MSRLGISPAMIQETFSVCKLVDVVESSRTYLSTFANIYGVVSHRMTIIEIMMERKTVKKVRRSFCGLGPRDFQEVLDYSNELMEKSDGHARLICREELSTIDDVLQFVTGHLWGEGVEPPEAMGALEDTGEILLKCFGGSR